jgi:hypothetical protein
MRRGMILVDDRDTRDARLPYPPRKRADALQSRLEKRMDEIKREGQISPLPPVVLGGLLVVPAGLIAVMTGTVPSALSSPVDTQAAAARAREIIMDVERRLGFIPVDREFDKLGYDIESAIPNTGRLRFLEVKGRVSGAATITVTRRSRPVSCNRCVLVVVSTESRMAALRIGQSVGADGTAHRGAQSRKNRSKTRLRQSKAKGFTSSPRETHVRAFPQG